MSRKTLPSVIVRNDNVNGGIDRRVTADVTVGGVLYTPAPLKAAFQGLATARQASDDS
jgi:hypothetical protein